MKRHGNALQLKVNGNENGSLCIFFVDTILTVINDPKIDVADKNVLPTRKKNLQRLGLFGTFFDATTK